MYPMHKKKPTFNMVINGKGLNIWDQKQDKDGHSLHFYLTFHCVYLEQLGKKINTSRLEGSSKTVFVYR